MAITSKTNPINGSNGILYLWNETDSDYQPVACLTSTEYGKTRESNEQEPTKCNPNEIRKRPGAISYTFSADGEVFEDAQDADPNKKFSALEMLEKIEDETLDFKYDFNTANENSYKRYFKGFVAEISISQEVNENTPFSITIEIMEKPTETDPNEVV